jgi:hypothetical protein
MKRLHPILLASLSLLLVSPVIAQQDRGSHNTEEPAQNEQRRQDGQGAQDRGQLRYQEVTTQGVLSSVPLPTSWQGQYNRANDVVVLMEPGERQIMLFAYAGISAREATSRLLEDLGGGEYSDEIREIEMADAPVATIQLDVGGDAQDWVLATERDGIVVAMWARAASSLGGLSPVVQTVLQELEIASRRRPATATGSYTLSDTRTLTLQPDGRFTRTGQDTSIEGRWQMRGERLLLIAGESFSNIRVAVDEEGITAFGGGGQQQWSRQ